MQAADIIFGTVANRDPPQNGDQYGCAVPLEFARALVNIHSDEGRMLAVDCELRYTLHQPKVCAF